MPGRKNEDGFPGFGMRPLGRKKAIVSPIGLAGGTLGKKQPTVETYRYGIERGINLFFWDPMFKNMTKALLELSNDERSRLFIYGACSFGGPNMIRKALTKRLKILRLERFQCFILGWVRSEFRVRDSVVEELQDLRNKGLCDNIGLSIHKRSLARKLYRRNIFDIFMLRYNAAHRGLEPDFLEKIIAEIPVSVIGYTVTRWGKLLKRPPGWEGDIPRPGDLYRFSLSNSNMDAVLMSPANMEELKSNLDVLSEGPLDEEEDRFIRKFGDFVYNSKSKIIGDSFEHSARM